MQCENSNECNEYKKCLSIEFILGGFAGALVIIIGIINILSGVFSILFNYIDLIFV